VIALTAFMFLAWQGGNFSVVMLCASMLGATFGFLKYNVFPARIFMGDAGSLVMGFILAFIGIYLSQSEPVCTKPAVPLLILGVPIIDTLRVMIKRLASGGNPFLPDKTHIHHKFQELGFQHRFTVIIIYGLSIFWSLIALFFHQLPAHLLLRIFVVVSAVFYFGLRFLEKNKDQFSFLSRDSSAGIRESVIYRHISERIAATVPGLMILILVYCLLAALFSGSPGGDMLQFGLVMGVSVFLAVADMQVAHVSYMPELMTKGLVLFSWHFGCWPHRAGCRRG
jgi:UDP-GlcNAc:undecaprenyl-phosphate GlcNAc-1-phosphate transferase